MTVEEYRKKYPKCAYCIHRDDHLYHKTSEYTDCAAMGKSWRRKNKIRWFCKLYEPKKNKR